MNTIVWLTLSLKLFEFWCGWFRITFLWADFGLLPKISLYLCITKYYVLLSKKNKITPIFGPCGNAEIERVCLIVTLIWTSTAYFYQEGQLFGSNQTKF